MALQAWNFDLVHSSINFSVRHFMVSKVHGRFNSWKGTFALDDADPGKSQVDIEIDAASIDTREEKRDAHLRSADFFDVAQFPTLHFKGTAFERTGENELKVTGDLTIHGVTRPVVLDVEDSGRASHAHFGSRAGFSAKTSISRKDFGLQFNMPMDGGGVVIGDKIDISIEIEAVAAAEAPAAVAPAA